MASVGLDISDKSIKYAELAESKGSLKILRHGEVLVPPGVIVSGKIEDKKKMIELVTLLKKTEYGHLYLKSKYILLKSKFQSARKAL